jgi:uroporphyrinogen decarboxylase
MKNSRGVLPMMKTSLADAISIDDLTPMHEARTLIGADKTLQGNLDSTFLFANNPDALVEETRRILREGGDAQFIFNLGHGVLPQTPREHVKLVVDTIKAWKASDPL